MILAELKEQIERLVEDHGEEVLEKDVYAVYDYGDHCHTQALKRSRGRLQVIVPKETAYSCSGLCFNDLDDDDEESTEGEGQKESVVIIK
jgi:hypothetical protein